MVPPDRKDIVEELAVALEVLAEVEKGLSQDMLRSATSQAYYAVFHAARAVLWSKGFAPKTHKGLQRLFHEEVVRPGDVDKRFGKIMEDLHDERQLADYHALTDSFEHDDVASLVAKAREFVETMEELLGGSDES